MATIEVFVSHTQEDNDCCRRLVEGLIHAGADVWYDEYNLRTGEILATIDREIRKRPVFVVLLSSTAVQSAWVRDECNWAYTLLRRDPSRIILPVVTGTRINVDDLPLYLQNFRRIEVTAGIPFPCDEAIQHTLEALELMATSDSRREPAPHDGDTVDDLLARGKALLAQGKSAVALSFFQRATERDALNGDTWLNLGYAHFALKQFNQALSAFRRTADLDGTHAVAWINMGDTLSELGRHQDALRACERALTIDHNSAHAWMTKGYTLNCLGKYRDALEALKHSTMLDPNNSHAWKNTAFSLRALGRATEAAAAEQQAWELAR